MEFKKYIYVDLFVSRFAFQVEHRSIDSLFHGGDGAGVEGGRNSQLQQPKASALAEHCSPS